jgi:ubiquinone/menaquinone biosynthesis C-methylase UbiE
MTENKPRIQSFSEGIDDQAVTNAFNKMQKLPQFKIIRNIVVKEVLKVYLMHWKDQSCKIVDIGCGTGHLLIALGKKFKKIHAQSHIAMMGVDISSEMVATCTTNLQAENLSDIEIKEGTASKLPYPDGSISICVSSLSLHHWTQVSESFNEIYRVLSPNGILILFDFRRDAAPKWHRLLGFATHHIVPRALRRVNEPLGSLLASYTKTDLQVYLKSTAWTTDNMKMMEKGMFLLVKLFKMNT